MAGVPNTLGYVAWISVAMVLAFVPGLPLAVGLGRRAGWDLPGTLTASFALQLATVGLVSLAAHYLSLSLAFVAWASLAILLVLGAAALLPPRSLAMPRPAVPALALGAACLALGVYERTWFHQSADAFYHLAAVRSLLIAGRPMVTDPFYGTGTRVLDPTSGVWHSVLAVWAWFTRVDVIDLWAGLPAIGSAITVVALWLLARRVSRSDLAATVAAAAWFFVSSAADVRWFAYPNRLSLGVAFVTLAALTALAADRRWPDAVLAVAAGFATLSMHLAAALLVAAAGLLLLAALAIAELVKQNGADRDWRSCLGLAATGGAIAVLSAPALLPRVSVVAASAMMQYGKPRLTVLTKLPGGMMIDGSGALMRVGPVVLLLAAALAAVILVTALRKGEPSTIAAAAFAVLPIVLLLDPPVTTTLLRLSVYMTSRVALMLPFTMFVGVAWALGKPSPSVPMRLAAAILAIAVVAAGVVASWPDIQAAWSPSALLSISKSRKNDIRRTWGEAAVAGMAAEFGRRYPVVAGDPQTAYYLSGVLPAAAVAVPVQHSPLAIEEADGEQRRLDMASLMGTSAPEAERRRILDRWNASYLVVAKRAANGKGMNAALIAELRAERELLRPVVDGPGVVLYAVVR